MRTIYETPAYKLEGVVTFNQHTGPTLELFATHPLAQHPRRQRILCLTMPHDAMARLGRLATADDEFLRLLRANAPLHVSLLDDRLSLAIGQIAIITPDGAIIDLR